jgi:hypothetical protein
MISIQLRKKTGVTGPDDLTIMVQENTFEYLRSSPAPEVRISAYFDRDYALVDSVYEEVFVGDDCPFVTTITHISTGSRTRKNIVLPGPMANGEQLIIKSTRRQTEPV